MFGSTRLLTVAPRLVMPKANYQHFVMSKALAQIERECDRICPVPRFPDQKVTVVGAGSDIGRVAALFLKQQKVVKVLALYDSIPERGVIGVATDLAHIDTSTRVEAYQGRNYLKKALYNTDVVLICGGSHLLPPSCDTSDRELFLNNMSLVRTVTSACARYCPHAVIAVQTPPVDATFALCVHTLRVLRVYDKRRVLGVNSIAAMRANQLFSAFSGSDPAGSRLPVICGTGKDTAVPVFSAAKTTNVPNMQVECISRLVREADEIICKVKNNCEQGHLSIGFATARFVVNIMKGLFEGSTTIDSALVEQKDPERCFGMQYFASPITVGAGGVVEYAIPDLNEGEKKILEESKCQLEDLLTLGRCYAVGDEYRVPPCKIRPPPPQRSCPLCQSLPKKK